jgi:hypothetical protein
MGNEAGNAVLLNDDVFVMHGDDLLDLDVLMACLEDEVCAVITDPLVLRKSQREPLETTGGRTLTNKLVRRLTDGVDLGPFVTSSDSWQAGRVIFHPGADYEVIAVVEAEPGENFRAYLVVRLFTDDR